MDDFPSMARKPRLMAGGARPSRFREALRGVVVQHAAEMRAEARFIRPRGASRKACLSPRIMMRAAPFLKMPQISSRRTGVDFTMISLALRGQVRAKMLLRLYDYCLD